MEREIKFIENCIKIIRDEQTLENNKMKLLELQLDDKTYFDKKHTLYVLGTSKNKINMYDYLIFLLNEKLEKYRKKSNKNLLNSQQKIYNM